jgi:hypothetical protein
MDLAQDADAQTDDGDDRDPLQQQHQPPRKAHVAIGEPPSKHHRGAADDDPPRARVDGEAF